MEKDGRPEFVTEEHLEYLDDLKESGVTNMFGATSYIQANFPELSGAQARQVLVYWMESYHERHQEEGA